MLEREYKKRLKSLLKAFFKELIKWPTSIRYLSVEFCKALREAAEEVGIDKKSAHLMAIQTTIGSMIMLQKERYVKRKS